MRVHSLATCLVFASLSLAAGAHAQTVPTGAAATSPALLLTLVLGKSKLDAEAVRKAVELELKRPVVLGTAAADAASLSVVAHANHTVTVSYRTSTGVTRSRSIGIPEDRARGAEVIALLSGNLSRDDAAELLADLAAKAAPPAEAAPAAGDPTEPAAQESAAKPDTLRAQIEADNRQLPSPAHAQPSTPTPLIETESPAINLTLVAPVALYPLSERRIFAGELGLGYSHVGELHGAGLNLFVLRTERDVRGASFATFYNDTGGTLTGTAGSALVNRRQRLRGFEFSGLLNLGSADAVGIAAAGVANLEHDFDGFQAAGLVTWADRFRGFQAAGAFSRAGAFTGIQAAGVLNRAGAFTGLQAAGAVNIAGAMSGLQLGVVNVAGDVHGLQLGVVNVAKHVDGASVGLVSVADNGRVQPVLWASSSLPLNAAAKFTVGPLYTQAGLGFGPGHQTCSYELGLGAHVTIGRLFLEPGVHYSEIRSTEHSFDELLEYGHYRVAAGLDLNPVSPFAGVGILQRFAHSAEAPPSKPAMLEVFAGTAFF